MTDIQTLQTYENWKSAKKKRKLWMSIISWVSGLLLAYITVVIISKCGLGNALKTLNYGFTTKIETKEEREKIPSDYLTFYKDKNMEKVWTHKKESSYFTYEEIAKRKAKKEGEDWFGELGGKLAEWWASQGVDESKKNEVDYIAYAQEVYSNSAVIIFWGIPLFWIIYALIFRYIILPLSWKEPKLTE